MESFGRQLTMQKEDSNQPLETKSAGAVFVGSLVLNVVLISHSLATVPRL